MKYGKRVIEYFKNPKFNKVIKNADGIGQRGNEICGDIMRVYIKVKDNKIVDVSYQTFGCVAAISSSEALCRLVKGKTIEEAKKITNKDIANHLGHLPSEKMHCSVLGMQTLHKAIEDYEKKKKK